MDARVVQDLLGNGSPLQASQKGQLQTVDRSSKKTNACQNKQGMRRPQIDEAFGLSKGYKIPQYDGAADQCGLTNDFGTPGLVTFPHSSAPEIASGRFSNPSQGQHSSHSTEISHSYNDLMAPASSTCPAVAHVNGPFDGPAGDGHCLATAQTDGQNDDDLTNDNFAKGQSAVTRTQSWVKGDDKGPLSTNLAVQALSSEECSCIVCRRRSIFYYILPFPIRQDLVEGAYPCTHLLAENSFQPNPQNCIGWNQEGAPGAIVTTGPTANSFTEDFSSSAEQATSQIPAITITIPPITISNITIPATTISNIPIPPITISNITIPSITMPIFEVIKVFCDDAQPGTPMIPTIDGHESTMQEPTCNVPTGNGQESAVEELTCNVLVRNGHESTMHEPTCDVPTEIGQQSALEEPTCDVLIGNGHESNMEEPTGNVPTVNGRESATEEFTCHAGQIPSTSSKWSWGFLREASGMAGVYGRIKRAYLDDRVRDRQKSASSCGDCGCGIINALALCSCSWFKRRTRRQEAHQSEPRVPRTVSDVHNGPPSPPNQSEAHQGGSETSPVVLDIQDDYFSFPCRPPPTPPSPSPPPSPSQNSEHQKSTNMHQAGRGTMKAVKPWIRLGWT